MSGKATVIPSPLLTGYYYFNQYWNNQVNKHFIHLVRNSSGGGAAQNWDLWNGNLFSWSRPPCFCPQRDSHRDSWLDLNKRHRVGTLCRGRPLMVELEQLERPSPCHGKVSTSQTAAPMGKTSHFIRQLLQIRRWGEIWKVWSPEITKSEITQIGIAKAIRKCTQSVIALHQSETAVSGEIVHCCNLHTNSYAFKGEIIVRFPAIKASWCYFMPLTVTGH